MTEQEAIKYLQMATDDAEGEFCELYKEMCKISIKALEKQIPKDLTDIEEVSGTGKCPSCKATVGGHQNYCWHCGQHVQG